MPFSFVSRISLCIAVSCLCAQTQDTPPKEAPSKEMMDLPPRAAASEYQAQAKAGAVTIGAEFMGHAVPTPDAIYNDEEYVVVETGVFGPPDTRLQLSWSDFSLRINGKKEPLPSQATELVLKSLKDPQWEPPAAAEKSKTSLNTGGQNNNEPPAPVHMPFELRHPMEQRVQKASLHEGNRVLPQAGLLFFQYRSKTQNIHSLELIYNGPAGKATLALQP